MLDTLLTNLPCYVLLFACFSMAGWVMEVTLKYIQFHRFINRGYLIGPYCPIYGWGALIITLLAGGALFPKCTPLEAFLVGFFGCGTLEYLVSWAMEKTSHARWWDYSNKPMNLNGRVWIGNLMLFGLAAVAIVYAADPFLLGLFSRMSPKALWIIAGAFLVILWTDRVISHVLMRVVRDCIEHQDKDDTEAIRLEMHRMLRDRSLLLRRISQAYPELQPRPSRLVEKLKAARSEYRAALQRARKQLREAARAEGDERIRQARSLQRQAREKLRAIERELLGKD